MFLSIERTQQQPPPSTTSNFQHKHTNNESVNSSQPLHLFEKRFCGMKENPKQASFTFEHTIPRESGLDKSLELLTRTCFLQS
jgi:hypothetical protein